MLESLFQILLEKRLWHLFSCEFCEISKNAFLTEHLWATASEHFLFFYYCQRRFKLDDGTITLDC